MNFYRYLILCGSAGPLLPPQREWEVGRRDLNLWSSFRTRKNVRVEFLPVIHGFLTALFGSARTAALMTLFGKWP